jgi:hypothetical protein
VSHHFIKDESLLRVIRQAMPAGSARDLVIQAVERFLSRQPRYPRLVGTTVAAKMLGIQPPHVSRLKDQGRMPDPITVEGSVDVYIYEEVVTLGGELHAEREKRANRRAEREEMKA